MAFLSISGGFLVMIIILIIVLILVKKRRIANTPNEGSIPMPRLTNAEYYHTYEQVEDPYYDAEYYYTPGNQGK